MTGFSLGLVATLMWIAVLTGLAFSFRTAPRPPDHSIREFRATRRRIAKVPGSPEVLAATTAANLITRHPPKIRQPRNGGPGSNGPRPRASADSEIDGLIRSLLAVPAGLLPANEAPLRRNAPAGNGGGPGGPGVAKVDRPSPVDKANENGIAAARSARVSAVSSVSGATNGNRPRPSASELSKRFARTDGDLTYILVDDEGRPQPNDN